jgi:hypothetical protein
MQESNPFSGLGMGAVIWMAISGILAFFAGGWTAGYFSGWAPTRRESLMHGAVSWALASIVAVWLITGTAGSLLSGGAGLIGQTITGGAKAAAQAPQLNERLRAELQRRGIDVNSIEQQAQSPETQAKAEQMARQAGQTVAKGVSFAALGGFVLLLLDLLSSLLGAMTAASRRPADVTTTERVA